MIIFIDGKRTDTGEKSSLKDILTAEGYLFPCGGQFKCGRCRITAPKLPAGANDKKFFTKEQLDGGLRLACDKTAFDGLEISCGLEKATKTEKLESVSFAAVLEKGKITVAVIDGGIKETVSVSYDEGGRQDTVLRSCLGKTCVELLEKYGAARAETVAVAGENDLIDAFSGKDSYGQFISGSSLYLPCESLYILPKGKNKSSLELCNEFSGCGAVETVAGICINLRQRNKFIRFSED